MSISKKVRLNDSGAWTHTFICHLIQSNRRLTNRHVADVDGCGNPEVEVRALTRLLAVTISAFRMSGSYLEDEDDLELTAGGTGRRLEAEPTLASTGLPVTTTTTKLWKKQSVELTARLRRGLVPPGVVQLAVLLLGQQEPLLLHLVDLLLGAEGVAGHRQVVAQHGLLLALPLGPRVLQLGALWGQAAPVFTVLTVS